MSSGAGCRRMGMDSGYADANGLHLYYEIHSDGGTPLVLLHGGVMTIELTYASLLPTLTQRHRVIGVDFQAHGRTADIDRDLTYANLASDVVGLLDHLGIDRAHVIGHSMGGGTALELAVNHPERLLSVVPISASVRPDGMHPNLANPSTYATSTRMPTEQDFADMAAAYASGPAPGTVRRPTGAVDDLVERVERLDRRATRRRHRADAHRGRRPRLHHHRPRRSHAGADSGLTAGDPARHEPHAGPAPRRPAAPHARRVPRLNRRPRPGRGPRPSKALADSRNRCLPGLLCGADDGIRTRDPHLGKANRPKP
jgi:pimeloyl-ACP methyl ester carboxylesterase